MGGDRGRLLSVAKAILASSISVRVLFFADADFDRILPCEPPENVVFTDGRDLECYGLTNSCIERLCVRGLAMEEAAAVSLFDKAISVARPIGILRVASERASMDLPFQRTLEKRGVGRFVDSTGSGFVININRLVSNLLQNAKRPLSQMPEIVELQKRETDALLDIGHEHLVHGKDLLRALAYVVKMDEGQIEPLFFLSMDFAEISLRPNVSKVRNWIFDPIAKRAL